MRFPWNGTKLDIMDNLNNPVNWLENFFQSFKSIAKNLENPLRTNKKPFQIHDEYDIQYLVHGFLILRFDDIRREEHTSSYAGGSSRIDFLLKEEKIPVESKITRKDHGEQKISEELIKDVAHYQQHNDCDSLVCFIYDPEYIIQNPNGFVRDLQKLSTPDFSVRVFISQ